MRWISVKNEMPPITHTFKEGGYSDEVLIYVYSPYMGKGIRAVARWIDMGEGSRYWNGVAYRQDIAKDERIVAWAPIAPVPAEFLKGEEENGTKF